MNKIILEKLIYKNYLKTAFTSILFIEITLIIIYFNVNNNIVNKSIDFILNDIKKSVYNSVHTSISEIEHKFSDIEHLSYILQNEHQNFFKYYNQIKIEEKPTFKFAKNGMYYKSEDNGGSSVVVSKNTKITKDVEKKLLATEIFDNTLKSIINNNEMIVASYFNSYQNFNRYYPFIENSYNAFPSDIVMENYNFYYEANIHNNPKKEVVWTDVYLDPAGQGWMISAIVPIYNNDFLEGVTGIDVTVNTIVHNFLSFKLPYEGSSFLIDEKGDVIAMTEDIKRMLAIKTSNENLYKSKEKILRTIYQKNGLNILKYEDEKFVNNLKKVLKGLDYSHNIKINDEKYLLFTEKIEKTNWFLISLINEEEIIKEVGNLENYYKNLGFLIIGFVVTFYLLFFIYLYSRAKSFVDTINKPLLRIIEMTKNLGSKNEIKKLEKCGIVEIDTLNENFNKLANKLEERTQKLVNSEIQRAFHEKLANTDSLTGVYNRRFLEDFSEKYMKIVKRDKSSLSILLVDIDNFKNKNDTYGHKTGDLIIKKLISCIKNILRDNDIIVRYGGDEFIVLLPTADITNARKVGNKLLSHINGLNKFESEEFIFTITIGTAEYKEEDMSVDNIIHRADESLYKAKELGKNCVV